MNVNYQSFGASDHGFTYLKRGANETTSDFDASQAKALYPLGDGTRKALELDGKVDESILKRTKDDDKLITDLKAFQSQGRAALGPEWVAKELPGELASGPPLAVFFQGEPKSRATEYTSPDSPQTIIFRTDSAGAETVKVTTPDSLGELTHVMSAQLTAQGLTNVEEEVGWLFPPHKAFK